ncbi:MAG TPA: GYD domain-containing protein [Gaiellaceae bacterium]|jgi:uncharacterized protein with GYD domain
MAGERQDVNTEGRCCMFTYIEFYKLTPEWREKLAHTPEYLEKIRAIIEEEGGKLEKTWAFMGPWDFVSFVKYPDNEAAFRVLAKIGLLGFVQTETYPAEEVEVFTKAFV